MKRGSEAAVLVLIVLAVAVPTAAGDSARFEIAAFRADVTPPQGAALCFGFVAPVREIVDPLTARGVVLFPGEDDPIVLCAVDFVAISNESHDLWRAALAEAAGTTPERVTVHTIHNHDAPGCDFGAMTLLDEQGLPDVLCDAAFHEEAVRRAAAAVKECLETRTAVTHIGLGTGIVGKVASNRRILGPDGRVAIVRYSASTNLRAIAAPEGVVDREVNLVSFWNSDRPLVSLTYYATHPQSYYGKGGVSADFVGMARALREEALPEVSHVHFDGAGGNVAAGKYNDGSKENRPILAGRLALGMEQAWREQERFPVRAGDIEWRIEPVALPWRDLHSVEELEAQLRDPEGNSKVRIRAARDLAYKARIDAGRRIALNCLRLGEARILFYPGELFVEYQLEAKKRRPGAFVAFAAYGDAGPGYIGTAAAYGEGGYETSRVSRTAPEVEEVLMEAMRKLLE